METVASESTRITWEPEARLAFVRYAAGATLDGNDGTFLTATLARWVGDTAPFSVLADASGLKGTTGEYRAIASKYFRSERHRAAIALVNMGAVVGVIVELFRIGTGVRLKACADERAARDWLRDRSKEQG